MCSSDLDLEVVETTVNEDNNPVSCTAQGHDSSGNLIVRNCTSRTYLCSPAP